MLLLSAYEEHTVKIEYFNSDVDLLYFSPIVGLGDMKS